MELIEKYPLDFLKNKFIFTESASKKKLVFPTVHYGNHIKLQL